MSVVPDMKKAGMYTCIPCHTSTITPGPSQSRHDRENAGSRLRDEGAASPSRVAPGVFRLPLYGSNVYFIQAGSSWVVVDTAWPWGNCGLRIRQAAATLVGPAARPATIVLTHLHPDHDGAALELARAWHCPVYLHPLELPLAVDGGLAIVERYANPLDRKVILPVLRMLPRRRIETMRARVSLRGIARALPPGADVPSLPGWRCVPTSGHSPGHIAHFRERDRVLIVGDAVLTVDVNSLPGWLAWGMRRNRPHVYGSPRYTNWNQRATDVSVGVLAALEPRVLATGHGPTMEGESVACDLHMLADRVAATYQHDGPTAA
jgi:glyoxylase-like metal-dependent hydrolase (beta-lactamase superfamily II)